MQLIHVKGVQADLAGTRAHLCGIIVKGVCPMNGYTQLNKYGQTLQNDLDSAVRHAKKLALSVGKEKKTSDEAAASAAGPSPERECETSDESD